MVEKTRSALSLHGLVAPTASGCWDGTTSSLLPEQQNHPPSPCTTHAKPRIPLEILSLQLGSPLLTR